MGSRSGSPLAIALVVMVTLAIVVERVVLRPLINRPPLTLFMATLGLSFVIEGLSQFLMGASVHELDLGIVDVPIQIGPILVSQFDLVAAASAGVLVLALSLLFNRTRIGISLRAIADDPQAALSIGIRLPTLVADRLGRRRRRVARRRACSGARVRACSSP